MVPALMAATTNRTRDDAYALSGMLRGAGTFAGTLVGGLLPMMFAVLLGVSTDGPAPYRWALLVGAAFGVAGMVPLMRVNVEEADSVVAETGGARGVSDYAGGRCLASRHSVHGSQAVCQSYLQRIHGHGA